MVVLLNRVILNGIQRQQPTSTTALVIMTRCFTKRNADTGLLRRLPKRNVPTNACWMHCGAGEISVLYTLHALIGTTMQQYVLYSTLLSILLAITSTAGVNANLTAINVVINLLSIGPVFTFETLQNVLQVFDHVLFDIPPDEAAQPLQMTLPKNLRIDGLSDPEAIRLTHFNHTQLCELYTHFGIAGLLDPGEDKLQIPTGWFVGNTPCQYRVDPEEAFFHNDQSCHGYVKLFNSRQL
jgi:hypothetical protein